MTRARRVCWVFIAALLATSVGSSGWAGEKKIALQEHLNRSWANELLTYPFEAAKGQCVAESVGLTGPNGPMPVQLSEVELWPGTQFVKSAKLLFVVEELKPQATQSYAVTFGPKPEARPAASDLKVVTADGKAEATASDFGVRWLAGEKVYEKPASTTDVPGPILGMRLHDGAWFGGSRMFGATPIKSYSAKLAAQGTVLARLECLYTYEDGNTLKVAMQLHARGHSLFIETDVKEHRPGDGWDLLLTPGLPDLIFQFPAEQVKVRPDARRIGDTRWKEKPLAEFGPGLVTRLTPWGDWFDEETQPDIYLKFAHANRQISIVRADPGAWVPPAES
ncbi:MAG: hypothetical protein FJ278_03485, partial [Planctomycetes bacterium]|nr:hypothetical protein [Planctomycetota bacterium]